MKASSTALTCRLNQACEGLGTLFGVGCTSPSVLVVGRWRRKAVFAGSRGPVHERRVAMITA